MLMRNYRNSKIYKMLVNGQIVYGVTTSSLRCVKNQYTHKYKVTNVDIELVNRIPCSFKENQDHLFLEYMKTLNK